MLSECRILVSVSLREVSEVDIRSTGSMAMLIAARNALRLIDCGNACSRVDRAFCFVQTAVRRILLQRAKPCSIAEHNEKSDCGHELFTLPEEQRRLLRRGRYLNQRRRYKVHKNKVFYLIKVIRFDADCRFCFLTESANHFPLRNNR